MKKNTSTCPPTNEVFLVNTQSLESCDLSSPKTDDISRSSAEGLHGKAMSEKSSDSSTKVEIEREWKNWNQKLIKYFSANPNDELTRRVCADMKKIMALTSTLSNQLVLFTEVELGKELGKGGQAKVYQARKRNLKNDVAVKIYHRDDRKNNVDVLIQYQVEAQKLLNMHHENVVQVYDLSLNQEGNLVVIMELMKDNLLNYVNQTNVQFETVSRWMMDICKGLKAIHDAGWIHCDLKLENIGIGTEEDPNIVKILDYGSSILIGAKPRHLTLNKASPEAIKVVGQNLEGVLDITEDIFQLGRIFRDLLTRVGDDLSEYQGKIDEVIEKATKNHSEDRYQDTHSLLGDILQIAVLARMKGKLFPNSVPWFQLPNIVDTCYEGYEAENITWKERKDLEFREDPKDSLYPQQYQLFKSNPKINDNDIVAIKALESVRKQGNEKKCLCIDYCSNTYIHSRIMREKFAKLSEVDRESIILNEKDSYEYRNSTGVHCTVITSDNKLLFCQRSRSDVTTGQGLFTCGAVETFDEQDIFNGSPNVFQCIKRGLSEELSVHFDENPEEIIKVTGFMRKSNGEGGFVAFADLRKLEKKTYSHDLYKSLKEFKSGKDNHEHTDFFFVDLDPKEIFSFIRKKFYEGHQFSESGIFCAFVTIKCLWNPTLSRERVEPMVDEVLLETLKSREPYILESTLLKNDRFTHGFPLRFGGYSHLHPESSGLNLFYSENRKNDNYQDVRSNVNLLKKKTKFKNLVVTQTDHGDNIWILGTEKPKTYDAIIGTSKDAGKLLGVFHADCAPVLILDEKKKVYAAVHSGWKGTLKNIVGKTVQIMIDQFQCQDIKTSVGPMIHSCCLEMDEDVISLFREHYPQAIRTIPNKEKKHVDLKWILTHQLAEKNVNVVDWNQSSCTRCDKNERFFSCRRHGKRFGCHMSYIGLRQEL